MSNELSWNDFIAATRVPASIMDIKNNPELGIVTHATITLDHASVVSLTNLAFKLTAMHLDAENFEAGPLFETIQEIVADTFARSFDYWTVPALHDVLEEVAQRLECEIKPSLFRDIFVNIDTLNTQQAVVTLAGRY